MIFKLFMICFVILSFFLILRQDHITRQNERIEYLQLLIKEKPFLQKHYDIFIKDNVISDEEYEIIIKLNQGK